MAKDKPADGASGKVKGQGKGKGKRARAAQADAASAADMPSPVAPTGSGRPAPMPRVDDGRLRLGTTRLANALGGASLCFGTPIPVGDRVVVPVARVRGAGGYGFGRGVNRADGDEGDGGGGGGALEATPAGFLDITPDGVRYEAIPDPVTTARALSTGASALTLLVSAVVGARRLSRRRAATALLPPP